MDQPRPTADLAAIPSWDAVRKAITDSYYDSREEGGTMETAANLAATRVQNLWSEVVVALARAASRLVGEEGLRTALHRWTCRRNSPHDYLDDGTALCHAAVSDPAVRAAARPAVGEEAEPDLPDGHDHVTIRIDRSVREALHHRLFEPDMRGVGYTEFIRRAIETSHRPAVEERLRAHQPFPESLCRCTPASVHGAEHRDTCRIDGELWPCPPARFAAWVDSLTDDQRARWLAAKPSPKRIDWSNVVVDEGDEAP